jgi:hypothetical protein
LRVFALLRRAQMHNKPHTDGPTGTAGGREHRGKCRSRASIGENCTIDDVFDLRVLRVFALLRWVQLHNKPHTDGPAVVAGGPRHCGNRLS